LRVGERCVGHLVPEEVDLVVKGAGQILIKLMFVSTMYLFVE